MQLVLTRKVGEAIVIGPDIYVTFLGLNSAGGVRIGVVAPRDVEVDRLEVRARKRQDRGWKESAR